MNPSIDQPDDLSDELKKWLAGRKEMLKLEADLRAEGGHIMLRKSVYDPDKLDEPLRSEALTYFETK